MNDMTLKNTKRFDMGEKIRVAKWHLRLLTWIISFPIVWLQKTKITKEGMEDIKGSYLLLSNHNAFLDFMVSTVAIFPRRANYVVAIDGYLKREKLLRDVGCICKRKFANDPTLVRHLVKTAKRGEIIALYPEARYSLCGTNAILPDSLGKLIKLLKVPVATFITKGHHINSPVWNLEKRGNRTQAHMKLIFTKEDLEKMTVNQINERISQEFVYDDFAWQYENKVKVDYKNRAKGLHKVLYQCPNCNTEYMMDSKGTEIFCTHCNKKWHMTEYGRLEALDGKTEFPHIPDWYEWERAQVRKQIEDGTYKLDKVVRIDSLPNAGGYVNLGQGKLTHDMEGFVLTGISENEPFRIEWPAKRLYSCHIEFDYLGKHGDCVDLNTSTDTLYIYPEGKDFSVTKISLATEELHKKHNE